MDTPWLEQVQCGILYLYASSSKRDFFISLESLLKEIMSPARVSVLTSTGKPDRFVLEYSTEIDAYEVGQTTVISAELQDAVDTKQDQTFEADNSPTLAWGEHQLPLRATRLFPMERGTRVVFALHDPINFLASDTPPGFDGFLFDHVGTAYSRLFSLDRLNERLVEADTRVEAIRLMGDVLGHLDLNALLSHLISACLRLTRSQVGSVVLQDELLDDVELGLPYDVLKQLRFKGGPSIVSRVLETGESVLAERYSGDETWEPVEGFQVDCVLSVPFVSSHGTLGSVNLVNSSGEHGGEFKETDRVSIMTICSLATPAIENAILHRAILQKEKMESELQVARNIQRTMYAVDHVEIPGYETAWISRSCDDTGGDYLDLIKLTDPRVAFCIGDVSGHGISAALLMATGRANLRALLSVQEDSIKEVVEHLNYLLGHDLLDTGRFMTCFLSFLDYERHELSYVNGGHDLPLFRPGDQNEVVALKTSGVPLGLFDHWEYDEAETLRFVPGSALFMTTDGVWEAHNAENELFGKERLTELFCANADKSAKEIIDIVLAEVEGHLGGLHPQDDLSLVVVKRHKE